MSKAKLMLTALGIIAIAATTSSYKISQFSQHFIYTGALNSGVCLTKVDGGAIQNGTATVAASTISLSSGCPNNYTTQCGD